MYGRITKLLAIASLAWAARDLWAQGPDKGLQLIPLPTDGDAPGTIFRIDGDGVRYDVIYLASKVPVHRSEVAIPEVIQSGQAGVSAWLQFAHLPLHLGGGAGADHAVHIRADGGVRQTTLDAEADALLALHEVKAISWRTGSKYYLIRETVSATGLHYELSDALFASLGGEATIRQAVTATAGANIGSGSTKRIDQTFDKPLRVYYKLQSLVRPAAGAGGTSNAITIRADVNEAIVWKQLKVDNSASMTRANLRLPVDSGTSTTR